MSAQHTPVRLKVICDYCAGSGETTCLSDGSPDAYEVSCNCPRCGGSGAIYVEMDEVQLHVRFESVARDSNGFKRSRNGTYVNPAVARDWKWFLLGFHAAIAKATGETP